MVVVTAVLLVIVIAIIFCVVHTLRHPVPISFEPVFKTFPDGSVQMEFSGVEGAKRTKRFHEEYQVGMPIEYEGQAYTIAQIKEHHEAGMVYAKIITAYLERA
ncbi:hypothetical protein CRD60_03940 [Bifidobacterium aemilianum]|uniref:Uncharacterized protein n=1 Tax=Bifidobacterium aemilianum TaxID=2493120 RepID=A0A366K7P5_9BIFI|nr:hypothetical protein [Bifidobacterium aemilianum]RBP97765.1 hypothetical protein CRD60_03940 [Bifidobacterium aemilianum]